MMPLLPHRIRMTVVTILVSILLDATVTVAQNDTKNDETVRCVTEWGLTSTTDTTKMKLIPPSQINDGYCDCIYSGLDETHTSACAGITSTTPTSTTPTTDATNKEIMFQCPQQPTLQLHLSRINDGICDCCDGADEIVTVTSDGSVASSSSSTIGSDGSVTIPTTTTTTTSNHCQDNCATVLAAYRAAQKQRQLQFHKGHEIRQKMITSYQGMVNTTKTKIKQLTHDITERKKLLQDKHLRSLTVQQQQYTNVRIQRLFQNIYALTGLPHDGDRYTKHTWALLHDVSIVELETLISYTCQMAGEMFFATTTTSDDNNNNDADSDGKENRHEKNHKKSPTPPQKTCVPLRLAAIDIGDMFVMSKEKDPTNAKMELRRLSQDDQYSDVDGIMAVILANIYDYNSQYPNHPIFMEDDYKVYQAQLDTGFQKPASNSKRPSGDDSDNDDDDYAEEYEEDEYHKDTMDSDEATNKKKNIFIPTTVYEDHMTSEQQRTTLDTLVRTSTLSKSRQLYIERAQALEQVIQDQITTLEQEQSSESEDLVLADEMVNDPVDHSEEIHQLRDILDQLQERIVHIERGYGYGISARKLLSSITKESMTFRFEPQFIFGDPEKNMKASVNDVALFHQQYLQKLFLLTLYYSQVSVVQVYELLYLSLAPPPTTSSSSSDDDPSIVIEEQQCSVVPYANLCPPKSTLNESLSVPKLIYDEMVTFCNTISMESTSGSISAETSTCAAVDMIPESIPDGYFGYYPIVPRDEDDVMTKLLNPLGSDATYCTNDEIRTKRDMRSIQETVTHYQTNIRSMEQTLQEMKESIQNNDQMDSHDIDTVNENSILPKYGLDGELHSIQDQCYDFTQGKYKYEICLYQGSSQKDIDSAGDGTSLGRWTGTSLERVVENNVEYYERIWKWENGAQCWNGPQRSITAHVNRCGPITKIISANEPDTCRYVVEVESPIACDSMYQQRYQLE